MISLNYYQMLVSHYLSDGYEVDEILSMIREADVEETGVFISLSWDNGAKDKFLKVWINLEGGHFVCLKYIDDGGLK
jgi:hypothetical protein